MQIAGAGFRLAYQRRTRSLLDRQMTSDKTTNELQIGIAFGNAAELRSRDVLTPICQNHIQENISYRSTHMWEATLRGDIVNPLSLDQNL